MEENKELLELLQRIEKTNRQQLRSSRLTCLFACLAALCCAGALALVFTTLPQITAVLPQVTSVIDQMQVILGNLEQTTQQLSMLDVTGMVSGIDNLVATGQLSLEQTMQKLNTIDIDTLNQAIRDLAAVVEPLAKVSSLFK